MVPEFSFPICVRNLQEAALRHCEKPHVPSVKHARSHCLGIQNLNLAVQARRRDPMEDFPNGVLWPFEVLEEASTGQEQHARHLTVGIECSCSEEHCFELCLSRLVRCFASINQRSEVAHSDCSWFSRSTCTLCQEDQPKGPSSDANKVAAMWVERRT
jgi:hypothetical protein